MRGVLLSVIIEKRKDRIATHQLANVTASSI